MVKLSTAARCAALVVVIAAVVVAWSSAPVNASVPAGTPVFSTPLTITNTFMPFTEEAIKVFRGVKDKQANIVVDHYLTETRTFTITAGDVDTHIIEEIEFVGGVIEEISRNYFAQADDGSVYYFGEVVNTFVNGVVTGHEGSWLVGGATLPSDPVDTADAPVPTVFMPANPEKGDVFKQEDLFPVVDETDTVMNMGLKVNVPAAKYTSVLELLETSLIPDTPHETKWYAEHVGVVKGRTKGEHLELIASTLTQ